MNKNRNSHLIQIVLFKSKTVIQSNNCPIVLFLSTKILISLSDSLVQKQRTQSMGQSEESHPNPTGARRTQRSRFVPEERQKRST